jgi:membrane protein required for colicin V production
MNWLDGLIVAIIIISTVIGLVRGLTREILSLISWALAIWVALHFSPLVAPLFEKYVGMPEIRLGLGFFVVFLGMIIAGAIINYLLSSLVRKTILSGTDRFLGIFFGASRGVLIVVFLLLVGSVTPLQHQAVWKQSSLLPKLDPVGTWVLSFVPEDMLRQEEET